MNRDPFYRQIEDALAGALDPEQFEQCAVDLLRPVYPGLVPIRGGQDGGRDGQTAMHIGNALFLVATTGEPARNLSKNLRSHTSAGLSQRVCVLATRRVLNASARTKLESVAHKLGYRLAQIHDGADFADRLYQSPPWCRTLLQISGAPPAISALPITHRPLIHSALIGREDDLQWLRTQRGDVLVVGQPGCGKTFLLLAWARETGALFVRRNDVAAVAECVRAQQPPALILDDAHLDPEFVLSLRQMRSDMASHFQIIANTWPGDADFLRRKLDVVPEAVRSLELLTRSEIVQVVKGAGVVGPTELMREIVTQASGRPGLAVTLTQLCLRSGTREVVLGDELAREVRTTFGKLIGEDAIVLLAAFALGGRAGMRPGDVAEFLGITRLELQTRTARLAAGGVLEQREDLLRLLPEPLRFALVRDIFFGSVETLPIQPLLDCVIEPDDATRVLIFAQARGANVSQDLIRQRLTDSGSTDLLSLYASVGKPEAEWVIGLAPNNLMAFASAGLREAPTVYVRRLLAAATEERNDDIEQHNHSLRPVREWVRSSFPGSDEALRRRKVLLDEAKRWLDGDDDYYSGLHALCLAFDPSFEDTEEDPAEGRTVTFRHGLLSVDELDALAAEWPHAVPYVNWRLLRSWKCLAQLIDHWLYPSWVKSESVAYKVARRHGWEMLQTLAKTAPKRWSVQRWARENAIRLGKRRMFSLPQDVEALFPTRDYPTGAETVNKRDRALERLAIKWAKQPPKRIARRWKQIVQDVEEGGVSVWGQSHVLALHLAPRVPVKRVIEWARAIKLAQLNPDHLIPFLERAAEERPAGWDEMIIDALSDTAASAGAVYAVLKQQQLPSVIETLLDRAVGVYPRMIGLACLRGRVPEIRLRGLLTHSGSAVAAETAINMWSARPQWTIPPTLRREWEEAIVAHVSGEYHELVSICEQNQELGQRWLRVRLQTNSLKLSYGSRSPAECVAEHLDRAQRLEFVSLLSDAYFADDFISALIGNDMEVYAALFARTELRRLHPIPLHGKPSVKWASKARVAIGAGWSPQEIAHSAWSGSGGWTGPESNYWRDWEEAFIALRNSEPDLTEVADVGASHARDRKERCLRAERREAVFGF